MRNLIKKVVAIGTAMLIIQVGFIVCIMELKEYIAVVITIIMLYILNQASRIISILI